MSTEEPKNLKLTPVSELKKKARETVVEGKLLELPSGAVMRVGRPSLTKMLKEGKIPGNLIEAALNQMSGKVPMTDKEIKESIGVVECIVMEAVKEPKIVMENPDENSISMYDLSDEDRGFIFQYVQTEATDLTKFRPQRAGGAS